MPLQQKCKKEMRLRGSHSLQLMIKISCNILNSAEDKDSTDF